MRLEEKIEKLLKDKIEELGYKLLKVEIKREWGTKTLTLFIDKEDDRISLRDCEIVSRSIEPILDEADLIKEKYYLIVSSPGI